MDTVKTRSLNFLKSFKKWILVAVLGVAGLLLVLGGFGLIQLSLTLLLYVGLILLVLAIIYYLIG